jgi:hypothetical protein
MKKFILIIITLFVAVSANSQVKKKSDGKIITITAYPSNYATQIRINPPYRVHRIYKTNYRYAGRSLKRTEFAFTIPDDYTKSYAYFKIATKPYSKFTRTMYFLWRTGIKLPLSFGAVWADLFICFSGGDCFDDSSILFGHLLTNERKFRFEKYKGSYDYEVNNYYNDISLNIDNQSINDTYTHIDYDNTPNNTEQKKSDSFSALDEAQKRLDDFNTQRGHPELTSDNILNQNNSQNNSNYESSSSDNTKTCMKPIKSSINMYEFYCESLSLSPEGYVFSGIIVKKTNLPIGPLKNVAFAANSFVDFYENSGYVGRGTLSHDVYVKPWCRNSVFIKLLGGNRYCFINTEMEGCGVVCGKIGESCIIDGIQYNAGDYFNFHGCNDGGVLTPCNVQ